MCEFISERPAQRDVFFAALVVPNKKSGGTSGGLVWYRVGERFCSVVMLVNTLQRKWIMIFQYPVVALVASLVTDITQAAGVYCQYLSKPYFAKLWVSFDGFRRL